MLKLLADDVPHTVSGSRLRPIYLLTFSLYIPTVLVVGLHGWLLSPLLIVVCDMFVYSEFMIHPIVLLLSEEKLRKDVWRNIVSNYEVSPAVL